MVNVYGFWDSASSPPSGFFEIAAGYQNRLILLGGTMLETGGSDTHNNHSFANGSVGNSGSSGVADYYSYEGFWLQVYSSHTHTFANPTQSAASHLPPYKNFRLIYRSIAGWSFSVPAGIICFSETVPAGFARTESGGSGFLRIASAYGGTGGGGHSHTGTGTTGNQPSNTGHAQWGETVQGYAILANHHHTWSYTSTTATPDYYYWSCGLIKASSDGLVPRDSYWLFDGDPGVLWTKVSADGYYLKISSTNAIIAGGAYTSWNHGHTFSGSSDNNDQEQGYDAAVGNFNIMLSRHTHVISFTLSNLTVTPSYVRLNLYKFLGAGWVGTW
jgi:hypothetical protein